MWNIDDEQLLWKLCKQHMINCGIILNSPLRFNRQSFTKISHKLPFIRLQIYTYEIFFLLKVIVFPHHLSTRSPCLCAFGYEFAYMFHTMKTPQKYYVKTAHRQLTWSCYEIRLILTIFHIFVAISTVWIQSNRQNDCFAVMIWNANGARFWNIQISIHAYVHRRKSKCKVNVCFYENSLIPLKTIFTTILFVK